MSGQLTLKALQQLFLDDPTTGTALERLVVKIRDGDDPDVANAFLDRELQVAFVNLFRAIFSRVKALSEEG